MRLPLVMAVTLSAGVVASAASSSGRDVSMAASGGRQSACADYIVIDSRGSGEAGGLSKPGSIFYPYFKANVIRRDPSARVAVIPNGYPAWGSIPTMISALAKLPQQYHGSVVEGKKWLSTELGVLLANCPGSKFVLTGYSQGAQVTGDVYQNTSSARIIGVVLFGDPKFNSADPAARGGTSGLDGALGTRVLFSSEPGKESIGHVLSYCHDRDPVCQGISRLRYGPTYHESYGATDEPQNAAKYLARFVGTQAHEFSPRMLVYQTTGRGFNSGDKITSGIVVRDLRTSEARVLASGSHGPRTEINHDVALRSLSPDGKWVVVQTRSTSGTRLTTYSTVGQSVEPAVASAIGQASDVLAWSPDSSEVALQRTDAVDPSGYVLRTSLLVYDLRNRKATVVAQGITAGIGRVSFSPDGRRLAFGRDGIYVASLQEARPRRVADGSDPAWGRDELAYTCTVGSGYTTQHRICVAHPDGGNARVILRFPPSQPPRFVSAVAWAPDGRTLLAQSAFDDGAGCSPYVVDARTGDHRELAAAARALSGHRYVSADGLSRDGRLVLMESGPETCASQQIGEGSTTSFVLSIPIAGGPGTVLVHGGAHPQWGGSL